MFRLFLIRLLLKLLQIPEIGKIKEKKIDIWFWTIMPQSGFQDYVTKRDREILQRMGNGVSTEEYIGLLYQRIELGLLLSEAKRGYARIEKSRQDKVEVLKRIQERQQQSKPKEKSEPKNENINDKNN